MTTTVEDEARRLRDQLAEQLEADGHLKDPAWRAAFRAVPRHPFVPEFWQLTDGELRHITSRDPGWLEAAYCDDALATQIIDGVATSSSTAPGLMAAMLDALDVADGMRVLEIATGTGYNAALLAERLGGGNVVSVEVDPALADLAAERLRGCGYTPTVLAGDGRGGHPLGAPYDRLIATCGFSSVPYPWVEQVRPGGVIVCPVGWGTVRLVVGDDGTAEGHFLPTGSYFMAVRDAGTTGAAQHPGRPTDTDERAADLDLAAPASCESFRFLMSLVVPGVSIASEQDDTGAFRAVELWGRDGSWGRAENGTVRQAGPRRLWDMVEEAHAVYEEHGHPGRERFGLTVTADRQHAWLDSPDGPQWHLPR
ncbi:methyltransferase domain-containing protein [Streptomyces sp. RPT161]|uniref:methyltransferase domain-containing protein n=1 Tax=Streptomyces sp. RPT161 TaxID=3015993 RepID=UPI0022B86498|nr:methyltransferase domain-containing protein [Streptomyces sp. RPT161]